VDLHSTDAELHTSRTGTIRACAPDVDMCDQLREACEADGMDEASCEAFAENICPANRYMSCKAIANECEAGGDACPNIEETCQENLEGCPAPKCKHAGTLDETEAIALCFAYPSLLDCESDAPDAGQCLELVTWKQCGFSSCEWIQCQEDLANSPNKACPMLMPASCKPITSCLAKEDHPPAAAVTPPTRPSPPITYCESVDAIGNTSKFCKQHPWGRPSSCGGPGPTAAQCETMLDIFEGCNVTQCEFTACAEALAVAPCGTTPPECDSISTCSN
jgi:hypothetical protein